jgi:hypothetical protein
MEAAYSEREDLCELVAQVVPTYHPNHISDHNERKVIPQKQPALQREGKKRVKIAVF